MSVTTTLNRSQHMPTNTRNLNQVAGWLLAATLMAVMLLCAMADRAFAGPVWDLSAMSNSNAQPGSTFDYYVVARNGDDHVESPFTVTATLPDGVTAVSAATVDSAGMACPDVAGQSVVVCTGGAGGLGMVGRVFNVTVAVDRVCLGCGRRRFGCPARGHRMR